jgi:hypothetical protein
MDSVSIFCALFSCVCTVLVMNRYLPRAQVSERLILSEFEQARWPKEEEEEGDRDSRVRFPAGAENFSLRHHVQNGSGAHPAFYPRGTRGSFPAVKAAGA